MHDVALRQARLKWKTRLFAVIVILSNALGNFFLARGMRSQATLASFPLGLIQPIFTPWVAAGVTLLILWLLSRMALLSWADLSYVLPVTSLGYVANALMGHYFLGEHITMARWAGTLLIVAGTVLVGMSVPHHHADHHPAASGDKK
jgi:drug/metabolite transporter (DMT)-like permease